MARVTIEDCLEKVVNRFALSVAAMKRARLLVKGAPILSEELGRRFGKPKEAYSQES